VRTGVTSRAAIAALAAFAMAALAACAGTLGSVSQSGSPGAWLPSAGPSESSTSAQPSTSPSASSDALTPFYQQHLVWTGCGGDFQCAKLTVPIDYSAPSGATTKVSVIRLRSGDPSTRIGSLVINPGGPGGSGVDFARAARAIYSPAILDRYTIVGFDPRGVASSDPVQCLNDSQTDQFIAADGTPDTPAELLRLQALGKLFADSCASRSPALYAHVDTRSVARDLDVLRQALGESKLNYFGASYGTYLGATYADLFPTRVGRMVLDGAIDPSLSNVDLIHGQLKGFEVAIGRFIEDCNQQQDCPLPGGVEAGKAKLIKFFAQLDTTPLATNDPQRPLNEALAENAVLSYLYFPQTDYGSLRDGLRAAFSGDGSVLLDMLDQRISRDSSGHYTDNSNAMLYAVNAIDRPDRPSIQQWQMYADQWGKEDPLFGRFFAFGNIPFNYWNAPATSTPHEIHAPGSPPILVVGTTYDPATPYPWAQALAKQLSKGVLLTRVGDGHTAYGMGSSCADEAIDRYLTTGVTPPVGTVCH
jgi:pimeloyl-ACP methyl ester carboxylesterase